MMLQQSAVLNEVLRCWNKKTVVNLTNDMLVGEAVVGFGHVGHQDVTPRGTLLLSRQQYSILYILYNYIPKHEPTSWIVAVE